MPFSTDLTATDVRSEPTIKRVMAVLPLVFIALAGFGFAFYRFGPHVLDPSNITWFQGDSTWHFLVWHFFRREAWGFPPGQVEGFMAPLGTSIGSADALPLLAFPLKVFNTVLPPDFQYLGPWLFICYVLQGVFGYLLARTFCRSRRLALLVGLFFLFSPVMIFRAAHIALSAHWILLFALWHYFASAKAPRLRLPTYAGVWLLIVALVGLIHPYLAAMVFPVVFVSLLREWTRKKLKLVPGLGLLLGVSGVLALEWWLSGLIGTRQNLELWGFDHFSMNLNALFNPATRSRVLPPLPLGGGQYEGFMYLGLGVIGLSVVALILLFRSSARTVPRRVFKRLRVSGHLPLAFVALCFALYALGKVVMFGEAQLFVFGFFDNFKTLTGTFRAPGRFFWPTFYLLYVALFSYLVRRLPPRTAALVLGAGLLVQAGDLKINAPFRDGQRTFTENLEGDRWAQLIEPFETIAVIPAFERTTANRGDYAAFAYLAASQGKRVTTGAVARAPLELDIARERLRTEAVSGPRNLGRLYVFSAVKFAQFYLTKLGPGLRCYEIGDYVACYSAKRDLEFGPSLEPVNLATYLPAGFERVSLADYLERYEDQTVVLVAEGGVGEFSGDAERFLNSRGARGGLEPGASYAAVLHHGRVLFEADDGDPVEQWGINDVLGDNVGADRDPLVFPKSLDVFSSAVAGKNARIVVDGTPAFKTERGVNVVVLDREFEVITGANFDTHVTDEAVVKK